MSDENLLEHTRRETAELRLKNELLITQEHLRQALEQRAAFELEVLNSRDHAIGRAAEIGELRYRLVKQAAVYEHRHSVAQADSAVHDANHRAHIARLEAALAEVGRRAARAETLERDIAALRSSSTWRLGRLLMSPVRAVKRLLRRA